MGNSRIKWRLSREVLAAWATRSLDVLSMRGHWYCWLMVDHYRERLMLKVIRLLGVLENR